MRGGQIMIGFANLLIGSPIMRMPIWRLTRPAGLALRAAEQSSRSARLAEPGLCVLRVQVLET
jgi:hypothetical protein